MKSDKLQNALGKIDPGLVARTENAKKSRGTHARYIAVIAAVLAISICLGVFAWLGNKDGKNIPDGNNGGNVDTNPPSGNEGNNPNTNPPTGDGDGNKDIYESAYYEKYTFLDAKYPTMAQFPGYDKYNSPEYDEWWDALRNRYSYADAADNLDEFFSSTITEFLSGHGSNNAVYSPLNVYFALAMLAEVSDGSSRAQILELLGADSIETLRKQANDIWNGTYCDDGTVKSILASSIWLNEDCTFKEETLALLAENYYASSFEGAPGTEEFDLALRSWLNKNTGGLADKLGGIGLDPSTVFALATTVYFSAQWSNKFSESKTKPSTFHAPTGDIQTDFMNRNEWSEYYKRENFSATRQSLRNAGTMYFILPDEDVSIDELLEDKEMLDFILGDKYDNHSYAEINLSIPKFDVQSNMDLVTGLQNLGVTDCFELGTSDFSQITDEDAFVSEIRHGAGVKIDEEGVIGAAYTVMKEAGSAPPQEKVDFILDRPFIFFITDCNGLPMFVGVVNQP